MTATIVAWPPISTSQQSYDQHKQHLHFKCWTTYHKSHFSLTNMVPCFVWKYSILYVTFSNFYFNPFYLWALKFGKQPLSNCCYILFYQRWNNTFYSKITTFKETDTYINYKFYEQNMIVMTSHFFHYSIFDK